MTKYTKPEIEALEFDLIDIIRTSGGDEESDNNGYVSGDNELPVRPRYWD